MKAKNLIIKITLIFAMLVSMLTLFCIFQTPVKADTIDASDVGYTPEDEMWDVDNVNDALDGLHRTLTIYDCLKTLTSTEGDLTPTFDPMKLDYELTLESMESEFTLEGTLYDNTATVTGLGTYEIDLGETKVINIIVTTQEGNIRIYKVTATRYDLESGQHNSKLKKLEVNGYAISPKFAPLKYNYETTVSSHEIDLNIEAEAYDSDAEITLTGNRHVRENTGTMYVRVHAPSVADTIYAITYTKVQVQREYIYPYEGKEKTFVVPFTGTYKLDVWGAQGGSVHETLYGGYGAYATGEIELNEGERLYINSGGAGTVSASTTNGGYNGGGYANDGAAGSGGGATHIALDSGLLKNLSSHATDGRIIIVAGGGGGSKRYSNSLSNYSGYGGAGGGFKGGNGTPINNVVYGYGNGGTQTEGGYFTRISSSNGSNRGSFGQGAVVSTYTGAGGGGGYYGGGTVEHGPAGGGSGYIGNSKLANKKMVMYSTQTTYASNNESTKTEITTTVGNHEVDHANIGDGYAKITPQINFNNKNNYLLSLTSDYGNLSPTFDPIVERYTLTLGIYDEHFKLSGILSDETATVVGLDAVYEIDSGETIEVQVLVTSEDGYPRTY